MIKDPDELRLQLKNNIIKIVFRKISNDQERVMLATLMEKYLPQNEKSIKENYDPNLFRVWDCEQNSWRSFRFEKVISTELL